MKIAAIGSTALEIEATCKATLSKFIQEGHEVHIIVARDSNSIDLTDSEARSIFNKAGLANIHFAGMHEYSQITQENASKLNSFIRSIQPQMAILPFWKSVNLKRKILARTALIACRGIGTILMYELDKNPNFTPNVNFSVSISKPAKQMIREIDTHGLAQTNLKLQMSEARGSSIETGDGNNYYRDNNTAIEAFESHRLSMVEDGWL
jgi:hypothetical protein